MMKLNDIFKNTSYDDTLFSEDSITTIESAIFMKQVKGVETPYIKFAIDFDEKTVRVARTLNLIAGDGQTNVLHLNTLDYSRWNEITKQEDWNDTYNEGFKKLKKLQLKGSNDFSKFNFDLVMANPPFAGDIKEQTILSHYELAKNDKGKWQKKVGRDIRVLY